MRWSALGKGWLATGAEVNLLGKCKEFRSGSKVCHAAGAILLERQLFGSQLTLYYLSELTTDTVLL
ncbi:MAG: hypothetical protein IGS48_01515 [Oscillatoriales cyanobacterium C42_A2020_001]|nr:hypothetical protein [Leptolyngbyaceae cyanobacterium C42_A2020_001]